jgi:hypothetical protein
MPRSYPTSLPIIEPRYPVYNNYQTTDQKLEQLKQQGVTVQAVVLQSRKFKYIRFI